MYIKVCHFYTSLFPFIIHYFAIASFLSLKGFIVIVYDDDDPARNCVYIFDQISMYFRRANYLIHILITLNLSPQSSNRYIL